MTLIASIITFSKKKIAKKNVTLDPRHGTLALDMEPSTLDLRQKDRLLIWFCLLCCFAYVVLAQQLPLLPSVANLISG